VLFVAFTNSMLVESDLEALLKLAHVRPIAYLQDIA